MRHNTPVTTLAAALALALALLMGVLLPFDNAVFAVPPEFDDSDNRSVDENTPPGTNIGAPISATDDDEDTEEFGNTLTYSLEGTDAALFDIDSSTGQLITKAPLNYEANGGTSHSVTVRVDDSESGTDVTRNVTINVGDVDEAPVAPDAPTVVSWDDPNTNDDDSTTSLKVVWHAPENTGPDISSYEVGYKKSTETAFDTSNVTEDQSNRTATISDLDPDTSYDVRVQATNVEGTGAWSFVGTGSTNRERQQPAPINR